MALKILADCGVVAATLKFIARVIGPTEGMAETDSAATPRESGITK